MPSASLGAAAIRHRVTAAVPSLATSTLAARRNTKAVTPDSSAASWRAFRGRCRIFSDLAHDAGETGPPQALLHGEQHIGVAAGLHMDDPVGMQAGEVQRRGKQVTPAQAPEDRALQPCQDAAQEDRRARVVGQVGTAGNLVQRASDQATRREVPIDLGDTKRQRLVPRPDAFDLGDAGAQFGDDGGMVHGIWTDSEEG
jgi:hypothetical protein